MKVASRATHVSNIKSRAIIMRILHHKDFTVKPLGVTFYEYYLKLGFLSIFLQFSQSDIFISNKDRDV